jgi:sRNA-binding carbon storage regulator CsrA
MKFFGAGGEGAGLVITRQTNESVILRKKDDPNWKVKITLLRADHRQSAVVVVGQVAVFAKEAANVKQFGALRMVELLGKGAFTLDDAVTIRISSSKRGRARICFIAPLDITITREEIDQP